MYWLVSLGLVQYVTRPVLITRNESDSSFLRIIFSIDVRIYVAT
jgi:hypothetical protein